MTSTTNASSIPRIAAVPVSARRLAQAIRILGRAWTRVLWRCWQDHTTYDPTKHRAATRHLATGG